jgi:hypothetical protein
MEGDGRGAGGSGSGEAELPAGERELEMGERELEMREQKLVESQRLAKKGFARATAPARGERDSLEGP